MKKYFKKIICISLATILTIWATSLPNMLANAYETISIEKLLNEKSTVDSRGVVTIPDENLRKKLKRSLGVIADDGITVTALNNLEAINLKGTHPASINSIKNISGLEHCINVTTLDLSLNGIKDLSPLAGLTKLNDLWLEHTKVLSNLDPLAGLTNLTVLQLTDNNIDDIGALSNLTNLKMLSLNHNRIDNLVPLANLTNLESLYLQNNQISNLNPLANLTKLDVLDLMKNNIDDIDALFNLTSIYILDLSKNQISNISPLAGLTNLEFLGLDNNTLDDISPLIGLTKLNKVSAVNSQISDISPLATANLPNLTALKLNHNQISDISPLATANLPNLTALELINNQISDIKPLAGLTNLRWLLLTKNKIDNLEPLAGLTNLKTVYSEEQEIKLPELITQNGTIEIDNPLIGVDGLPIDLTGSTISHNGNYNITTNKITWTGVTSNINATIEFSTEYTVGKINPFDPAVFSGKITQPIKLVNPYTVTVNPTTNGTASVDKDTAKAGETVTITTTPNAGYELDTITATGASGANVSVTGNSFTMPAEDVTVEVTFKAIDYTVTVNTDANGTASVDKDVANVGETVTITTTPNAGYELNEIKLNGTVITGNSFTMPAEDVVVEVTFKAIDYTVTVNPTTNGTASVDKDVANVGETVTITTTPNAGYELNEIKLNGTVITGNSFTMPAEDVVVEVTFKAIDYTVIVNTDANGTANVDKDVANVGDVVTITTTPNAGYELNEIKLNGTVITGNSFTMPAEDVVVEVTFKAIDYTVTVNTDANGTASVDKDVANVGDVVTITTTPNSGYELNEIKVNGTVITGNSFTMPAEDVVVEVTFKAIDYTVTVNTDANGTASVDKDTVKAGETVTITTTPNSGYELNEIKLNGTVITGNSFTMPAEDVTVAVTFKAIDYTVTINPTTNGTASVDKDIANIGDIITLTINADAGYQLKAGTLKVITASGIEIPLTQIARIANGTFTFEMPAEDITIFAEFELIPVVTPPVEPEVPEPPVVEPETPQPPTTEDTKPEVKPETGKNPITGTAGLAGILGAMGLAGATTLFTRKRKNK